MREMTQRSLVVRYRPCVIWLLGFNMSKIGWVGPKAVYLSGLPCLNVTWHYLSMAKPTSLGPYPNRWSEEIFLRTCQCVPVLRLSSTPVSPMYAPLIPQIQSHPMVTWEEGGGAEPPPPLLILGTLLYPSPTPYSFRAPFPWLCPAD